MKTTRRKPNSLKEKPPQIPKLGSFREAWTLISLIDKPDTFRERETAERKTNECILERNTQ